MAAVLPAAVVLAACGWAACGWAAGGWAAGEPPATTDTDSLAHREAELVRQFRDLERSFLRLADLLATSDPHRAAVLREAFEQAREAELGERLDRIVALLEEGQMLAAGTGQEAASEQFRSLLDLLEEGGRERNLADNKQQVREFLARVGKLIARQRDIEGSTEAGGQREQLAARQREAADDASDLGDRLERFARRLDESAPQDGGREPPAEAAGGGDAEPPNQPALDEPPDQRGEPGSDAAQAPEPAGDDEISRAIRTRGRLEAAERRMREAERRLGKAERNGARAAQQQAIEELESAHAELQEILRQTREREVERLLVQLETRVRAMLKREREILAGAGKLATDSLSGRERELEAARLGREQEGVTADADRTLSLVRDDGSAVAVPEALGQVRDDSAQAAARLARSDLTPATLGLVGDVVTGLEELLEALEKSRRDEDAARQEAGPGGGRPAEPQEQPLVDRLAELKMLRGLQARVNARTERFAALIDDGAGEAGAEEIVAALGRLADRQRAIERAARDIVTGRTER